MVTNDVIFLNFAVCAYELNFLIKKNIACKNFKKSNLHLETKI